MALKNVLDQLDLIDIHNSIYLKTVELNRTFVLKSSWNILQDR